MRALVAAGCMVMAVAAANAAPAEDLAMARDAYRGGRFAEAIPLLTALLYPQPQLADRSEIAEAHVLLGVSYFETGDPESAGREFEEALFLDSSLRLDPLLFSDRVARFFAEKKQALEDRKRSSDEAKLLAEERDAAVRAMENMYIVEKRDFYVNFIPFGAGQIQNGDRGKAIFFAVSQGVFGATSLGLFTYLITKYRFQDDVPRSEANQVRNLQILQVTTGAVTLGLMGWGIIDALVGYQPTVRIEPDKSLLPKHLRERIEKQPAKTSRSLNVFPMLHPTGGGISSTWTF